MNFIKYAMAAVMATCLAMAGSLSAQTAASNSIEAMVAAMQGDRIAVKIDLKQALTAPPTGFSVANPAKIAFDFPSTANGIGKNSITFKEGDLQSANVVQVGDRTRVVLNLTRSLNYTTRIDGNSLYIDLAPIPAVGSLAERVTQFAPETSIGKRHALQDVAFRRGKDGEGRVVVDLNNTGTGIDIRQQGKSLVVDFLKTSAPENLRRKLDVTDFGTPVTSVETKQIGDNVRMTIMPHGLWEHNAYQSENQFVIEVKKIIEDPNKLVQGTKTGYQGPRVSINYQNGDVRALLRLMAEELGLNTVISETVSGTTTLVLKDVP
ncbi:MAG: AMIN domain-containing protein, partial [Azonexus sp.]